MNSPSHVTYINTCRIHSKPKKHIRNVIIQFPNAPMASEQFQEIQRLHEFLNGIIVKQTDVAEAVACLTKAHIQIQSHRNVSPEVEMLQCTEL